MQHARSYVLLCVAWDCIDRECHATSLSHTHKHIHTHTHTHTHTHIHTLAMLCYAISINIPIHTYIYLYRYIDATSIIYLYIHLSIYIDKCYAVLCYATLHRFDCCFLHNEHLRYTGRCSCGVGNVSRCLEQVA
jgi:hypothetical protein